MDEAVRERIRIGAAMRQEARRASADQRRQESEEARRRAEGDISRADIIAAAISALYSRPAHPETDGGSRGGR